MLYPEYRGREYARIATRPKKYEARWSRPLLPLAQGKGKKFKQGKVYDKVKNKIYLKRTQLLRGFPGRESVCLGKYARVDSGFGV